MNASTKINYLKVPAAAFTDKTRHNNHVIKSTSNYITISLNYIYNLKKISRLHNLVQDFFQVSDPLHGSVETEIS